MGSFTEPDARQRQNSADKAKKAMLEKYTAATKDPALKERQAERAAVVEARTLRQAQREKQKIIQQLHAKKVAEQEAEQAAEAARVKQETSAQ